MSDPNPDLYLIRDQTYSSNLQIFVPTYFSDTTYQIMY